METLPVEVIPNIAQYLEVKDLASCCAVSPWWREVFGTDEVWRPRCDVFYEEYLRTTPCQVEPKFISPQSDNSTLSPIGRWRTAYMREAHMWRNWISGNCVEDKIKENYSHEDALFLNDDFVVIASGDVFELIDTSVNPSVCTTKLDNRLPSRCFGATAIHIHSDMFITWSDGDVVQVIGVDLESRNLSVKRTFCVSERETIQDHVIVGSVFVGISSKNCVHIWNLESGSKLKTEYCFLRNGRFSVLDCSKHCEDIIVTVRGENDSTHCFIYSLKELKVLSFTTQISTYFMGFAIIKPYVALSSGFSVKVYNYENSKLLHDIPVNISLGCDLDPSVRNLRDSFIFINDNRDLVQLSPTTGDIRHLRSATSGFFMISEKLVDVEEAEGGSELYKVGPTSTVKVIGAGASRMIINQAHSKLVKIDEGGIVCMHFW